MPTWKRLGAASRPSHLEGTVVQPAEADAGGQVVAAIAGLRVDVSVLHFRSAVRGSSRMTQGRPTPMRSPSRRYHPGNPGGVRTQGQVANSAQETAQATRSPAGPLCRP